MKIQYKIFSLIFLYPSQDRLDKINTILPMIRSKKLRKVISEFSSTAQKDMQKLQEEYISMFSSDVFGVCPPYEGAYYDPTLTPYIILSVEKEYLKEGLKSRDDELPDHISTELEFMFYLSSKENTEEKQLQFLQKHLLKWVPKFRENIERKDKNSIYLKVAYALEEFLKAEKKKLERKISWQRITENNILKQGGDTV